MKKRKRLPIFLEFSIISSIIIVSIICVYSVVQLISMNMLTIEYEEEQIEKRYEELSYILSNIELKDNTLNDIIKDECISEKRSFISDMIDKIKFKLDYSLKSTDIANYNYSYEILAETIISEKGSSDKILYKAIESP